MKKVVLAVDDSESIRSLVMLNLLNSGWEVLTAYDGYDALDKLATQKIDLIITDIQMPNLNGYELLRILRKKPQYANIPVVILSSLCAEQDIAYGYELGATSYLAKPFQPSVMTQEVGRLLRSA